jgi:hypothetical protein
MHVYYQLLFSYFFINFQFSFMIQTDDIFGPMYFPGYNVINIGNEVRCEGKVHFHRKANILKTKINL